MNCSKGSRMDSDLAIRRQTPPVWEGEFYSQMPVASSMGRRLDYPEPGQM